MIINNTEGITLVEFSLYNSEESQRVREYLKCKNPCWFSNNLPHAYTIASSFFLCTCFYAQESNMDSNLKYSTCVKHTKGESVFSSLNIKIMCCTKGLLGECEACFITLYAMEKYEKYGYDHTYYWVEITDTMVCMMREPRGQVIKSMLGFLIFSSRSWSSSQRSSFTNSATYMHEKKPTPFIKKNKKQSQYTESCSTSHFHYIVSIAEGNLTHHTKTMTPRSSPLTSCEAAVNRIHPSSREMMNSPRCSSMFTCPPPNSTMGYTHAILQSRINTRLVFTFSW